MAPGRIRGTGQERTREQRDQRRQAATRVNQAPDGVEVLETVVVSRPVVEDPGAVVAGIAGRVLIANRGCTHHASEDDGIGWGLCPDH